MTFKPFFEHEKTKPLFLRAYTLEECVNKRLICTECGLKNTVYGGIFQEPGGKLRERAFCFDCLSKRCRAINALPFPIEFELYERLKRELPDDYLRNR